MAGAAIATLHNLSLYPLMLDRLRDTRLVPDAPLQIP